MALITDPSQAKAELDINELATKAEVMRFVENHHRMNVIPGMQALNQQSMRQAKQQDIAAHIVNDLIDFLEIEGFRECKDGRLRLNAQEFNSWRVKRVERDRKQQKTDA